MASTPRRMRNWSGLVEEARDRALPLTDYQLTTIAGMLTSAADQIEALNTQPEQEDRPKD